MLSPVIDYFNSITPLPPELVHDIIKYAVIKEYKKNEFILKRAKYLITLRGSSKV